MKTIFLDRDGVITVEGGGYVARPADVRYLPGALGAIARLYNAGWQSVIFTNQSGVGRGFITDAGLLEVHEKLRVDLRTAGAELLDIYVCPHKPGDNCACRKPLPGMLLQAAVDHQIDLHTAWAVGDTPRDIAAAAAVGASTALVLSGHTRAYEPASFPGPVPTMVCKDLPALVDYLLASR